MGNTFKQRTYQCECGVLTKEFVWDSDLDKKKIKCSECNKMLSNKHLFKDAPKSLVGIRTPTKNR